MGRPRKTPTVTVPAVPTQPGRNGGTLLVGNPGNRGGGRQPSAYRTLCREIVDRRQLLERLGKIASGEIGEIVEVPGGGKVYCETPVKEQRLATEALLAYGVGKAGSVSPEEVKERLRRTVELAEGLPEEQRTPFLAALQAIWD